MSTLSIATPRSASRTGSTSDADARLDARFEALVHPLVPAQRGARTGAGFENVFDLDYGHRAIEAVPAQRVPQAARRVRAVAVKPRPVAPRSVRLTRRGRVVALLTFLALALAVTTLMGGWATASLSGGTPERVRVIEVAPGDTLYDIAADIAQPGEIRAMVHRIQELNSLPGAQISEGQQLAVPRG